ncbi:MAG TPA: SRPBCC family protein [Acidimicrobiales bacterium]|nr:SRPBCC family protein [Acidimicrobiales bacterium]
MTPRRASVRREVRIPAPAGEVWGLLGDPGRLGEWFPGVESCRLEEGGRRVTIANGLELFEEIVTLDPLQRRLQYRVVSGLVAEHLATLDVLDLGEGASLALYSVDAAPAMMALVLAGAGASGLEAVGRRYGGA